jgi:hypothetical protein
MGLSVVCNGRQPGLRDRNRPIINDWNKAVEMISVVVRADEEIDAALVASETLERIRKFRMYIGDRGRFTGVGKHTNNLPFPRSELQ